MSWGSPAGKPLEQTARAGDKGCHGLAKVGSVCPQMAPVGTSSHFPATEHDSPQLSLAELGSAIHLQTPFPLSTATPGRRCVLHLGVKAVLLTTLHTCPPRVHSIPGSPIFLPESLILTPSDIPAALFLALSLAGPGQQAWS